MRFARHPRGEFITSAAPNGPLLIGLTNGLEGGPFIPSSPTRKDRSAAGAEPEGDPQTVARRRLEVSRQQQFPFVNNGVLDRREVPPGCRFRALR